MATALAFELAANSSVLSGDMAIHTIPRLAQDQRTRAFAWCCRSDSLHLQSHHHDGPRVGSLRPSCALQGQNGNRDGGGAPARLASSGRGNTMAHQAAESADLCLGSLVVQRLFDAAQEWL